MSTGRSADAAGKGGSGQRMRLLSLYNMVKKCY